jgi:hypothetical protein
LEAVRQDLRAGRNVVLALPDNAPTGMCAAIAERVMADSWSWRKVNLEGLETAAEGVPATLHRLCCPGEDHAVCNVRSLAESPGFSDRVIWIEGILPVAWPAWKAFLIEYDQACRVRSEGERGILCVQLSGAPAEDPPDENVALCVRRWGGYVDRLDMALYLSHMLPGSGLYKRIAVFVGVEVAGYDKALAEVWASWDLKTMLAPMPALAAYARQRGWTPQTPLTWLAGATSELEGVSWTHSCHLALQGQVAEINRRIWRGQIGVVFPFIEESRIALLKELKRHLVPPFCVNSRVITDPYDLEVGEILYLVHKLRCPVSRETKCLLEHLKEMRHALAHLEVASIEHLNAPEVRALACCRT